MPTVNEIVRRFATAYRQHYRHGLLPSHAQAMRAIASCRTEALGSHQQQCLRCGYQHRVFHSCKNRSCPQCFFKQTQAWLKAQAERLLPVPYFHLVFTLPSELRPLLRSHQKTLYPILFRAAAQSLQALAADRRYVGGQLGITAVLHTWSGAMLYHPHLHCLVPGVGLTSTGQAVLSNPRFLVPVRALSAKFRGRFLSLARQALPNEDFSSAGAVQKWVVFSKPVASHQAHRVLNYLGRYLHRMAISNASVLRIETEQITFGYKKSTDSQGQGTWGVMQLPPLEFLRRFLQHVLPKGMAKVRYYGFLAPGNKTGFLRARTLLRLWAYLRQQPPQPSIQPENPAAEFAPCPQCGASQWKTPWNYNNLSPKPP